MNSRDDADIFTNESAQTALSSARLCTRKSKEIIENIEQSRKNSQ